MRKGLTKLVMGAIGIALSISAFAGVPASQKVIVIDSGAGNLETIINSDTGNNNGTRLNPQRVYMLHGGQTYIQLLPITFGTAQTSDSVAQLNIVGDTTGGKTLPFIYQNPLGGVGGSVNTVYGNLELRNLYISVITPNGSSPQLFNQSNPNSRLTLDNVVTEGETNNDLLDFTGYGRLHVYLNNSYFRDNTQFTNPWNFAIISPSSTYAFDTLMVTNTTVANSGLTFFGKNIPINFVFFDHNTLNNSPKYGFFYDEYLEAYFTNNVFVNVSWIGECEQMEVSQIQSQAQWGPIRAGILNESKAFIDTVMWRTNYPSASWTSHSDTLPHVSDVKFFASNDLDYYSPYLNKYFTGGYGDSIGGNSLPVPYPISYLNWGSKGLPALPSKVYVPTPFTGEMFDSLMKVYPRNLIVSDIDTANLGFNSMHPGDQASGDVYGQFARYCYGVWDGGIIHGTPVKAVGLDSIKQFMAFGDMNPTTFPGIVGGVKTENAGANAGIRSVNDLRENFGYTSSTRSKIDAKHLGSLQWYGFNNQELSLYNPWTALANVKQLYTDTLYSGVNVITPELTVGKVYPNPTTGSITIEVPNADSFGFNVYDLSGSIVLSEANVAGNSKVVDISTLAKGIYIIKVTSANQSFTQKVILE